ncbi:MAG: DegT/DnrJ/EryC1/StrS family aminotransferase [Rhodocyclaceae bacterium]|nr:DegT/DnrJ/EryC1/StrS family aminotransferase [Rhodocyclaceae bacterium]
MKAHAAAEGAQSPRIRMSEPGFPSVEQLAPYLERIGASRWLTNRGPLVEELEAAMASRIGGGCHVSLVANGTIALICALRAAGATGEVITTPYTYIATAAAIAWAGCKPVFADIDPGGFNICAESVERLVTPATSAILAVHVYGHPCDDQALRAVARRHGLGLIYDAAHCFGAGDADPSVCALGDFAAISLHATKMFHAVEGGAVVSNDLETKRRIDRIAGFGLESELAAPELGLNGRMSELHAAVGLANLDSIEREVGLRRQIAETYRTALAGVDGLILPGKAGNPLADPVSYFPLRVTAGEGVRDALADHLASRGITARRYFFPLVSEFEAFRDPAHPASESTSEAWSRSREVLCLPIHGRMRSRDGSCVVQALQAFFTQAG